MESSQSMDDFLRGLDMSMSFGPFQAVDLARVAQLIAKTNQFNTTTRRHSLEDVARFVATDRCLTLQFRLVDRFGDNGLVSVMILRRDPQTPDLAEDRHLGHELPCVRPPTGARGYEYRGGNRLPRGRSSVARRLHSDTEERCRQRAIFDARIYVAPEAAPEDGATRWFLPLSNYVPHPTYITRRPE